MITEVLHRYYRVGMAYTLRPDPEIDAAFEYLGVKPGTRSRTMREAILAYAEIKRLRDMAKPQLTRDQDIRAVWNDLEELQATLTKILNR